MLKYCIKIKVCFYLPSVKNTPKLIWKQLALQKKTFSPEIKKLKYKDKSWLCIGANVTQLTVTNLNPKKKKKNKKQKKNKYMDDLFFSLQKRGYGYLTSQRQLRSGVLTNVFSLTVKQLVFK